MPGETPAQVPETVAAKPKKPSAGRLLDALKKSLGLGEKKPSAWDLAAPEAPASAAVAPVEAVATPPPAAEAPSLPPSPASLLPPVPEEEWQRLKQQALARAAGLPGAVMEAASAEIPASPPVPIPGGEPRDLDASEVAAMYGQDRKSADAARAESYRAETQAAHMEELPDWLQGGQGETPAPMPSLEPSTVAGKTGTVEGDAQRGMEQFAAGLDASFEDKAREYAARIAVGEDPRTMGVPESLRARVSELVPRDKAAALEAPELSKEQGPVEALAPAPEVPLPVTPAAEAEKNPEQLAIEQFEEALLAADESLAKLRGGEVLDDIQLRTAKAAAAKANGVIRSLPEHYLRVLLASRRLGENRDYTRMDFQKDMLAAIRVFSQTKKG